MDNTQIQIKCQECDKICRTKGGLATHVWRIHGEGQNHKPTLGKSGWSKGLTKETDERVKYRGVKIASSYKEKQPLVICSLCSKFYPKMGLPTHIWRTHGDGKEFNPFSVKGGGGWNKGLTKDTDDRVKKSSEKTSTSLIGKPGRSHTENTKEKLSQSMKKAHAEGRAHNIGQDRWKGEPSYPEKFFMQIIDNEFNDKNYIRELYVGKFVLDFAWIEKKLVIEIDGGQHEKTDYKERDVRKDKFLGENGWTVFRIKWFDLYNNTKEYIQKARDFIDAT